MSFVGGLPGFPGTVNNRNSTTNLYINSQNTINTTDMINAISLSPFLTVTSVVTPINPTEEF